MTWRPDTYGNRVRAAESRREAFLASNSDSDDQHAGHLSYRSQEAAQDAADHLAWQGRTGYKPGVCEHCGHHRIVRA